MRLMFVDRRQAHELVKQFIYRLRTKLEADPKNPPVHPHGARLGLRVRDGWKLSNRVVLV